MGTVLSMAAVTFGPALSNASWISCASFAVDAVLVDKHSQAKRREPLTTDDTILESATIEDATTEMPFRPGQLEGRGGIDARVGAGRCQLRARRARRAESAARNRSHGTIAPSRISAPFSFLIWRGGSA